MVVQAYILIQTDVGKAADVAKAIAEVKGVTLAEDVTGPYDVIVRAEARNVDASAAGRLEGAEPRRHHPHPHLPGCPHLSVLGRRSRDGRRATSSTIGVLLLLTGCGGPVEVDVPDLDAADAAACEAFADDLPDTLGDEERVDVEPADAPAAAYGDPAIVVTCGVGQP